MSTPSPSPPWWTFGHVWLVLAGPALVIVASFVTLYLALSRPEFEVDAAPRRLPPTHQASVMPPQSGPGVPAAMLPAVQARNQASQTAQGGSAGPRPVPPH
jgi:uncharacterized protein